MLCRMALSAAPRTLDSSVQKFCVAVTLLTALIPLVACDQTTGCSEELARWKLPRDLHHHRLREVRLPEQVDHLRCLPEGVEVLEVLNSRISSTVGMPSSVRSLNLLDSPLADLSGLPVRLRELHTSIKGLGASAELPAGLEVLTADSLDSSAMEDLPASLSVLSLKFVDEMSSLESLPESIRSLELEGPGVRRLASIPPAVRSLRLASDALAGDYLSADLVDLHLKTVAPVREELPPFLATLTVEAPPPWPRWPNHLIELAVTNTQPNRAELDVTDLPRSLRVLKVTSVEIVNGAAGLPLDLAHLTIIDSKFEGPFEWPDGIEVLEIVGGAWQELPPLPEGLRELRLEATTLEAIPAIPSTVTRLDLSFNDLDATRILVRSGNSDDDGGGVPLAKAGSLRELVWRNAPQNLTLPTGLKLLDVSCSRPGQWMDTLPETLECLHISGVEHSELPLLPRLLRHLDARGTGVGSLESLPPNLEIVELSATGIAELGVLPRSLRRLVLGEAPCLP